MYGNEIVSKPNFTKGCYVVKTDREMHSHFTNHLLGDNLYLIEACELEYHIEELTKLAPDVGISRRFYDENYIDNAGYEAETALMQDFVDCMAPRRIHLYSSSSLGRVLRHIKIIGVACADDDSPVALRVLNMLKMELKNGNYNIREILYVMFMLNGELGGEDKTRCLNCINDMNKPDCIMRLCNEMYVQYGDIDMLFEEFALIIKKKIKDNLRGTGKASSEVVQSMLEYINDNYHRDISLKQLSERFYLNPGYICRIFKRDVGLPLSNYLVHLRIRHSCRMLRYSNLTVAEISQRCGYSDYFYFARQFKRIMNVTPTQYRRDVRIEEELPQSMGLS